MLDFRVLGISPDSIDPKPQCHEEPWMEIVFGDQLGEVLFQNLQIIDYAQCSCTHGSTSNLCELVGDNF